MAGEKRTWYRTGGVAKMLGTSPHKIRELARVGLIESEVRNGYRYVSGEEVQRLRNQGLPLMPASGVVDDSGAEDQHVQNDTRTPTRSRLTQELYAEPSHQLARSKEKLIRLEHEVEAKRLKQQSREIDRAAREEQARAQEAQRLKAWRDPYIRCAVGRVPAEVCADLCARINDLLDTVPPFTDVTGKVAELIEIALRPIKKREAEARALQAYRRRISAAARWIHLPFGAILGELEEARELALNALANLPVGCSDRQLRTTAESAIQTVADRISRRKADEEQRRADEQRRRADEQRRQQESWLQGAHKTCIAAMVANLVFTLREASKEELEDARQRVRTALEQLPPTATHAEMSAARDTALAPIKAAIERRQESKRQQEAADLAKLERIREAERRTDSLLPYVETRLRQLEDDGSLSFDTDWDRRDLRNKVTQKIRPLVVEKIAANSKIRDYEIKLLIRDLVDEHHVEFCEEADED